MSQSSSSNAVPTPKPGQPIRVPDRIGVVGDVHGSPHLVRRAIETLARRGITQIHFLGDFGFPSSDPVADAEYRALFDRVLARRSGVEVLVTLGNHEEYDVIETIEPDPGGIRWWTDAIGLLPRGWRGETARGRVTASLGGANSIDRFVRVARGWPWSKTESITEQDLERLGTSGVDVLLGHDAPYATALTERLVSRSVSYVEATGRPLWEEIELEYANAGQRMFHRAVQQARPRMTISGHYHLFIDSWERYEALDGTWFDCRSIVMNADGRTHTVGVVDLDALEFAPLELR